MKILRVAQTVYPDVTGGGAYHVHAMSRDQAAMGHDVTVLTVRESAEQPHVETRDGYTIVRFSPTATVLGNALSVGLARYLASAEGFDVLHAHSHLYASTNLAALRRRIDDVPLAITNHGLYSQTAPERVFDAYLRTVGRWTFEQADVVFCYTDVDEHRLRELGVTSDVAVVANGVDTQRFSPDGSESDRLDDGDPAILFVGRLVEGKRPQDAVAAMEQVREQYPDATLYCCGDGPLRAGLQRRVDGTDDLADAVSFLGHVDYDEMPAVYRAADVLALPSRAEGMPRTVLEARATGIPVVTTELEHLAALESDGVRTVPVEDVDELAAAIVASLENASVGGRNDSVAAPSGDGSATLLANGHGQVERPASQLGESSSTAARHDWRPTATSQNWRSTATGLDWRSTVRETTTILRTLTEAAPADSNSR